MLNLKSADRGIALKLPQSTFAPAKEALGALLSQERKATLGVTLSATKKTPHQKIDGAFYFTVSLDSLAGLENGAK